MIWFYVLLSMILYAVLFVFAAGAIPRLIAYCGKNSSRSSRNAKTNVEMELSQSTEKMHPVRAYLFLYNFIQTIGWSFILIQSVQGLHDGLSWSELYSKVEFFVQIFQTAAILEIVHSCVGLVRSPTVTTVIQVFSRLFIVWPVLYKVGDARDCTGVPMLLIAWSFTEVIRYSFYALTVLNEFSYWLTWCRYTFFIVLYPLGAGGELYTIIRSLPEVAERNHFTLELPNPLNISFYYFHFLIAMCLIYLPGFPHMYFYMFDQRKKVLGGAIPKTKKQK